MVRRTTRSGHCRTTGTPLAIPIFVGSRVVGRCARCPQKARPCALRHPPRHHTREHHCLAPYRLCRRASFGGVGATTSVEERDLPAIGGGDTIRVDVDATKRTLTIWSGRGSHTSSICLHLNDSGGTAAASSTSASVAQGGASPEPLALAVALKFASDGCILVNRPILPNS